MSPRPPLLPQDTHNAALEAQVHPKDWQNPTPSQPYHLVVIGAGTAGLVTAAGAAGLGARVALVERDLMGGDCLNVGCVPSKALLASARVAAAARSTERFGVQVAGETEVDFPRIMERMRRLRAQISPHDSARRFADLGVDVYLGQGCFDDDRHIVVTDDGGGQRRLEYRKAVLATGARAAAPALTGLDTVPYLTNETLFSLTELPARLGIVGGGPIGSEMAQAFTRFGSRVILLEKSPRVLSREDADASQVVQQQFLREGMEIKLNADALQFATTDANEVRIRGTHDEGPFDIVVDQCLLAAGRAPNVEGLHLERVGVDFTSRGVTVNDHLQTTNPRIFACGDICSSAKFTHAADFQARMVIQNALFALGPFGRARASTLLIPWTTYTSPELAHVGLYPEEARQAGIAIDTYTQPFEEVDRAILDGDSVGFVRVHVKQGTDQLVGATVVSPHAGDLISELTLAMNHGLGLGKIGSTIHPYPTRAEAIRKLGDQFRRTKLTPFSRRLLEWLRRRNVGP